MESGAHLNLIEEKNWFQKLSYEVLMFLQPNSKTKFKIKWKVIFLHDTLIDYEVCKFIQLTRRYKKYLDLQW